MKRSGEIVVLGMYDLKRLDRAMPVRIHHLHLALQQLSPTRLLSGNRMMRRRAVARFLLRGGLRHTRAVYVEASTSSATETDLIFLALVRTAGIPLITFIPDAYQLFPNLYPREGFKVKLLDWGWRVSIHAYLSLSHRLLFPSYGLAACFHNRQPADVLPPAGIPDRELPRPSQEPQGIVYVGAASHNNGSDLLLDAMEQVTAYHPHTRCYFITGEIDAKVLAMHPSRHAPWLTVEHRSIDELPDVMRLATVLVIPRRINAYNDLAMPVKLFDYMSFGRPVVATACRDTAALVDELEAGLIVEDTADGIAQGIMRLLEDPGLATRMGQNGYQAIQTAHAWAHRAAQLLQMIEALEQGRGAE